MRQDFAVADGCRLQISGCKSMSNVQGSLKAGRPFWYFYQTLLWKNFFTFKFNTY